MKKTCKAGLLAVYGKFIENAVDGMEGRLNSYVREVSTALKKHNIDLVYPGLVGSLKECQDALGDFSESNCEAVIVLFLTYTPSLELAGPLCSTKLPIIFLDTTPVYDFCSVKDPGELMYNHGIHGLQDLCCVLKRRGKSFCVEAGHLTESDVVQRIGEKLKITGWVRRYTNNRVGLLGEPMVGMGDFCIPFEILEKKYDTEIDRIDPALLVKYADNIQKEDVKEEFEKDKDLFILDNSLDKDSYNNACRTSLALRNIIEDYRYTAVTVNNIQFKDWDSFQVVPFFEYSKMMGRNIGYAGEGDVVTAMLGSAFLPSAPESATFTEMFCPDWKNGRILLCHAGEVNINIAHSKPTLVQRQFTVAGKPAISLMCWYKAGDSVLVDLVPSDDGSFTMIVIPGWIEIDERFQLKEIIAGLFRPAIPLERMLKEYSYMGGTHHLVILYQENLEDLEEFARLMSWKYEIIH
jgi:L-arabinose isomerase